MNNWQIKIPEIGTLKINYIPDYVGIPNYGIFSIGSKKIRLSLADDEFCNYDYDSGLEKLSDFFGKSDTLSAVWHYAHFPKWYEIIPSANDFKNWVSRNWESR